MTTTTATAWIRRCDVVLGKGNWRDYATISETIQFATSMLAAFYGPQSAQLKGFLSGQDALVKMRPEQGTNVPYAQFLHAQGAIKNAKAELEDGLIIRWRVLVAGEILSELVRLGKEALEEQTQEAKNVAAVLVAAAFEGLIRRMGDEFAFVTGRPKLEEVITALKGAEVLKGGEVATALSYLKFRNDSLHADWGNVDRPQVQSCVAFVEALLVKHFS
jgi:hypothetical protein